MMKVSQPLLCRIFISIFIFDIFLTAGLWMFKRPYPYLYLIFLLTKSSWMSKRLYSSYPDHIQIEWIEIDRFIKILIFVFLI